MIHFKFSQEDVSHGMLHVAERVCDQCRLWARSALQLSFYRPGDVWAAVALEDFVCDYCVDVFGVD